MREEKIEIRRMLVLSTAHLPPKLRLFGTRDGDAGDWGDDAVVYPLDYGFLLWVPDNPLRSAPHSRSIRLSVLRVQVFARRRGCDYVMFDRDAEQIAGLPVFDSEPEEQTDAG